MTPYVKGFIICTSIRLQDGLITLAVDSVKDSVTQYIRRRKAQAISTFHKTTSILFKFHFC